MSTPTNTIDAGKRESPLHPGVLLERRLPPFYAAFFYAFPIAIAWIWLYHAKPGRSLQLWAPPDWPRCLAIGAGAGFLLAALTLLCSRTFAWARRLEAEFGWMLGRQRAWEIAWIAFLSGAAEEYLFRGALQEKFGLWLTAAAFGIIHWPLNRNFWMWPILSGVIGLGLGALALWTGSIVAPVAAHIVVNYLNLTRIASRFRDWDEDRARRFVETGKDA